MAISRRIDQDSQGVPIFKKDNQENPTNEIDHDLDEILEAWYEFKKGTLQESEYIFSVNKSDIDTSTLNINPQHHLPSLNESLKKVLEIDGLDGWSIATVGEITKDIYKGTRFKHEDLEIDIPGGSETRTYYTPAALLQDRGENVKLLDLSKATESRKCNILKHELKKDQILITRSGTIGRVIYVTDTHSGHIGSDDLIRVVIKDNKLRYYVYGFLKMRLGQDQMKRNEYGTIQQHLEPTL